MRFACFVVTALFVSALCACGPATEQEYEPTQEKPPLVQVSPDSDPRAIEIATEVFERLGGRSAWDSTRFVSWKFFGARQHYWDRHTGDVRIESPEVKDDQGVVKRPEMLVLMNIHDKKGRVWEAGEEVTDPERLARGLDMGHQWWVNDSYWMFMPYKLLDSGVTIKYAGERALEDGRMADVLDLTFGEGVGYTPQNRYEVFVVRDSGLVEQWSFYSEATEEEPRFTLPWADWKQFGKIWLATAHGQEKDWAIAVHDELPGRVFEAPDPVTM